MSHDAILLLCFTPRKPKPPLPHPTTTTPTLSHPTNKTYTIQNSSTHTGTAITQWGAQLLHGQVGLMQGGEKACQRQPKVVSLIPWLGKAVQVQGPMLWQNAVG